LLLAHFQSVGAVSPTLGAVSFSECFLVLHVFGIAAAFCMQQDLHFGFYGDLDKSQPSRRRLEKNRSLYM
jgi:hypothetical protein